VAAGRANWTKSILNRLQEGDIGGGLKIFLDRASGLDSWENRPDAHRQISRDNAWTWVTSKVS
jgi:hypothetical protein